MISKCSSKLLTSDQRIMPSRLSKCSSKLLTNDHSIVPCRLFPVLQLRRFLCNVLMFVDVS